MSEKQGERTTANAAAIDAAREAGRLTAKTTDVACPACGDKCGVNKVRQPAYSNAIYLCLARHYRKDDHGQVVQCWVSGHTVAAANARIAQARKP